LAVADIERFRFEPLLARKGQRTGYSIRKKRSCDIQRQSSQNFQFWTKSYSKA
jgi:hypothetical protein